MNHSGMNYSLASRELIADSIESMYMAYKFDGLVLIGNCDKIVPGMLMAAARLNVPCVYVSGGPMLPGRYNGEDSDLTMGGFEAVGAYTSGKIDDETLKNKEETACQTCGSCAGMYTANTINCLAEVLGIALPGNGTIPAPYGARKALGRKAGKQIMEMVEKNICARDILTREAFLNAITVDMAIGGSTNTVLHLMAIANQAVPLSKIVKSSTPSTTPILRQAGWPSCAAISRQTAPSSSRAALPRKCSNIPARRACSILKTKPLPPSPPTRSSLATSSSSATKGQRAALA